MKVYLFSCPHHHSDERLLLLAFIVVAIKVYRANAKVEPLGDTVMVRRCNGGVTLTLIVVTNNLVVITV